MFEDGGQRRDLVHVRDVVRALLAADDAGPATFYQPINIGTGLSHAILDIARLLARTLGLGVVEPHLPGEFPEGDIRHWFADVSRARSLLSWEARTPLEEDVTCTSWRGGPRPRRAPRTAPTRPTPSGARSASSVD